MFEDSTKVGQSHIQEVYHSCRQVYGSPRIHAELRDQGIMSSRKRVAHLMREQGLSACRRPHRTTTTKSEPGARVAPNLLDQDFTATRPDEKWTGDITAVWTIRGMALPGSRAGSVLPACNRLGDGGDPGRNAH